MAGSPVVHPQCGAIVRFSNDGRPLDVVAHGFRNPYDLDFDAAGHLLTVDSDGERDHHLPGMRRRDCSTLRRNGARLAVAGSARGWNRPAIVCRQCRADRRNWPWLAHRHYRLSASSFSGTLPRRSLHRPVGRWGVSIIFRWSRPARHAADRWKCSWRRPGTSASLPAIWPWAQRAIYSWPSAVAARAAVCFASAPRA